MATGRVYIYQSRKDWESKGLVSIEEGLIGLLLELLRQYYPFPMKVEFSANFPLSTLYQFWKTLH